MLFCSNKAPVGVLPLTAVWTGGELRYGVGVWTGGRQKASHTQ